MMNAAAPSVGGDRMAPMPAAASTPPPCAFGYPALRRSGHDTLPSVTVVATPDPDTVPSRKPASVTVRPGPALDCPNAAKLTSRKNLVAPEYSSTAP
jgi:hypothetical protein